MQVVVESHSAGVGAGGSKRGNFGMLFVKAGNGSHIVRLAVARPEVGMTLRTSRIGGGLKQHRAFVFQVAGGTFRSEGLIGVVQGRVVAGEASLVGYLRGEGPSLCYVAQRALL